MICIVNGKEAREVQEASTGEDILLLWDDGWIMSLSPGSWRTSKCIKSTRVSPEGVYQKEYKESSLVPLTTWAMVSDADHKPRYKEAQTDCT